VSSICNRVELCDNLTRNTKGQLRHSCQRDLRVEETGKVVRYHGRETLSTRRETRATWTGTQSGMRTGGARMYPDASRTGGPKQKGCRPAIHGATVTVKGYS
jgi:hypothetical protein